MSNLLIRHIPEDAIQAAKMLAAEHHHSLQEEVSTMLVEAIRFRTGKWSAAADAVRKRLKEKRKPYSDSVGLLRADRSR